MPKVFSRYCLPAAIAGFSLLGGIALAIYWDGLGAGFFFDDQANILLPEGVRMEALSAESVRAALASGHAGPGGRSVAQLSFALNHYFSGFDPFFFKLTNLAIHLANAILIFVLARKLLGACFPQISQCGVALAAALISFFWLLHPIQLTSVLLVVQRMTSLSAFFLLAALLVHIRGRELNGLAATCCFLLAWMVFWPLSFFSKETAVLFPFFVLAWELIIRRAMVGSLDVFSRALSVVLVLLVLLGVAYAFSSAGQWLWAGYEFRNFSLLERVLTEGRVLWFYLGLIFAPSLEQLGLYHDDLVVSKSLISPWQTLPALLGLLGLLWLSWLSRKRAPLISMGIVWYFIGHALESTVLPLEIAHEHRNYLPLFGGLLVAAGLLLPLFEHAGRRKTFGVALVVMALIYIPLITSLRAHQYGDDVRRTQIEAQHHRGSARAHYEAGQVLSRAAENQPKDAPVHALARRHFEQAMELDPVFKMAGLGLIYLDCLQTGKVEHRRIDELSTRLRDTPFGPGDTGLFYGLKEMSIKGTICLERKDVDTLFIAALENPRILQSIRAKLFSWHADYLWLQQHDLVAARDALQQSLQLVPFNASNRLKWAQLALLSGDAVAARDLLEKLRGARLSVSEQKTFNELMHALGGASW